MGSLDRLRRALKTTNAEAFEGLAFEHKELDREVQRLKAWVGGNRAATPPANLIRDALGRFVKVSRTENLRETRLVAFGCVDAIDQGYRLIEDPERFPKLLECVDRYREEARPFRRCYRGLLNGYFTFDPTSEWSREYGRRNWETLRSYLHSRIASLNDGGLVPEWVEAITEHANLVTADPCGRYGLSLLKGEGDESSGALRRLGVSEASWVTTRLILSQVEAAASLSDAEFSGYIRQLLDLLDRHPVVANSGLAVILTRYRACRNAGPHADLREFSIGHWGNPWLSSNSARWSHVAEPTRLMVADWLKLDLIREFFNLLAEDGSSDTRRLKFWQRYHKQIDDMYFALGRRAANSGSSDFRELRRKMEGRVLGLDAAGARENNAFIMCIGGYVVVEFGIRGNACFVFRRSALPFGLSGQVAGDATALKHSSHVERLLHIDRAREPWERVFEKTLGTLLSIRPTPGMAPLATGPGEHGPGERPVLWPERYIAPEYSQASLDEFCLERGLTVWDLTQQGGNLWVTTDDASEQVNRRLRAWGFFYREGRGWWRSGG